MNRMVKIEKQRIKTQVMDSGTFIGIAENFHCWLLRSAPKLIACVPEYSPGRHWMDHDTIYIISENGLTNEEVSTIAFGFAMKKFCNKEAQCIG